MEVSWPSQQCELSRVALDKRAVWKEQRETEGLGGGVVDSKKEAL